MRRLFIEFNQENVIFYKMISLPYRMGDTVNFILGVVFILGGFSVFCVIFGSKKG